MSLMSSLMYAVASVALLALVLECCCRRRLKRLREGPQILALSVNNGPYPVVTPYPEAAACPGAVLYRVPVAQYSAPAPPPTAASIAPACYVAPYPALSPPHSQNVEAPPPSYEQVMASERARGQQAR